jgi:hypothetical protein
MIIMNAWTPYRLAPLRPRSALEFSPPKPLSFHTALKFKHLPSSS